MLMRTEAEVKNMKVSQARIEATSSAKRAAQSAGSPYVFVGVYCACTWKTCMFHSNIYSHNIITI